MGHCSKLAGRNRGGSRQQKGSHQHGVAENGRLDIPCYVSLARTPPNHPFPAPSESPKIIARPNHATVSIVVVFFLATLPGCVSISELPQSISQVDFDSLDAGKTKAFTYEDGMVFTNVDKRTVFLAAKEGLMRSGFTVKQTDFDKGTLFGYHDMTAHDWNVVAGVYLKESNSDVSVKVIAKTSKDFSLVGNLGDTTSGSWPQMILSGMQDYIMRESSITNPSKKHFR